MDDAISRLTRAGGAMANLCYNLKQQPFGTERIREQMDQAQAEWDAALAEFPAVTAELSRLTRENEALREAAVPFMLALERDISPDEADTDRFVPMLRHNRAPHITVGDFRRLATAAKEG